MALTKTPIELSSTPGIVDNSNATAITIDSSENVGIGTSSPNDQSKLTLQLPSGTNGRILTMARSAGSYAYHLGVDASSNFTLYNNDGTSSLMAVDTSGNLLVGKTASNSGTVGVEARATGRLFVTADGAYAAKFERLSSDGTLIQLTKDGATVGSWRSRSGLVSSLVLDPRSTNSGCGIGTTDGLAIVSTDNTGALVDSGKDLGQSGVRWRDLYLSGGVYLGGTGAANKLDDYEEGTFTPTLIPTGGGSITLHTNQDTCTYVKVGNLVTVFGDIAVASVSSPSGGYVKLSNLPFSSSSGTEQSSRSAGSLAVNFGSGWSGASAGGMADNEASYVIERAASSFAGNDVIRFQINYLAA